LGRLECRKSQVGLCQRTAKKSVELLSFGCGRVGPTLAGNVLALGAVADFGAQNCQYTTKVDAR